MQNWRLGYIFEIDCYYLLEFELNLFLSKTKVFLKYYHNEELQGLLNKYLKNAVIIQTCKCWFYEFYRNFKFYFFSGYRKYLARKLF